MEEFLEFIKKPETILALVGLGVTLITAFALFITLYQTNKFTRYETYQRLELASIDLFQFEIEQSDKTWRLYDKTHNITKPTDEEETQEIREMLNHVTQMLNLFEMSIELHKKKVFEDKIFATWVKWIYEITQSKNFQVLWKNEPLNVNLRQHYTGELYCLIKVAEGCKSYDEFVETLCDEDTLREKNENCYKKCYKTKLKRYARLKEFLIRFYDDKEFQKHLEKNIKYQKYRCYE